MSSTHEKRPSASGSLTERPVARLLQQLFRKQVTGRLCISDGTGDQSDVYLRDGMPVYVQRPVDTDRLDHVLVEYGVVPEEAVARAIPMIAGGMRLGEALEQMGVLSKEKLADVLKEQMRRKLTRLFCVAEGSFAIHLEPHSFGEGDDLAAMRVDPRTLLFPAIRAAYDLPRVTRELSRLWGQEFHLAAVSPSFIAAMGIPADDPVVAALRTGWLNLEKIDSVTARPLEVRTVLLSLYYADLLERQNLGESPMEGDPARRAEYLAARAGKKPTGSTVPTVVDAETTFLKGEVFLRRGDHEKAIECFAASSKANPGEPQYRAFWAWARFENPRGRKEAVVREVQRIIADVVTARPRFARGHYWLGQIWKFLNEPDRAERAFREAVNQDKDFLDASREMRLLEMRRTRASATRKNPDPPRGGIMSRLF